MYYLTTILSGGKKRKKMLLGLGDCKFLADLLLLEFRYGTLGRDTKISGYHTTVTEGHWLHVLQQLCD